MLDDLGFSPPFKMGGADWSAVRDTPGVYVIFEGDAVLYVGMAGRQQKGSLRGRLRDYLGGQIVNMFAQYLLFARLLGREGAPTTPLEANRQCRAYIREHCAARVLSLSDGIAARDMESRLREQLQPELNAIRKGASGAS